jgi:hypothetical protein
VDSRWSTWGIDEALKLNFPGVQICKSKTLPMLVGSNFNIIGRKEEQIMMILMLVGLLFLMLSLRVLIYGEIILGLVGGSYPPTKS